LILLNDKWINYKLLTDTDGKHKAFIITINETNVLESVHWYYSKICAKFSSTLVETQPKQKELILETYLGQLGSQTYLSSFWLKETHQESGNGSQVAKNRLSLIGIQMIQHLVVVMIILK
jgi:hypothetical protein